ncbi:MAG TPA: nitroreductase family protein [Psychrobacter sp.]|uniref:Nitroreductase family protein n=1 Tax=Psychrobacter pasteurii TaxID=1945520 RepID=A0A1R4EFT1_9GAMM|nr:nitroreductase family protein [Psychrobacter pasteurii]SJM37361.1 Nitroreductase family protein [Psychrobacter pasteurii]HAO60175.1 nitroreductase family protein [Psychrobacter sp.]HJH08941.1 nitroreductase family protein [Psychrobacter pasteurii]
MSNLQAFQSLAEARRSIYAINDQLPVSKEEIVKLVEHAVLHTPSAFNSQSSRLVVLFGEDHEKLWQITEDKLRAIVNDDTAFESTKQKIDSFKAGAGTVLFYEDQTVVKGLQENFALYADRFPVWSEHTSAMHQYAIWTALASLNIGASLQHYNPIIDEDVDSTWNIDPEWNLVAQLVFGGIEQPAGEKEFAPVDSRLKVFGV